MEAIMSFLLVTAALTAVIWMGLKSLKSQSEKVALQPVRIHKREQQHRRR